MTELNYDAARHGDQVKQANPRAVPPPSRFYAVLLLVIVAIGLATVLTRSAPEILALVTALSKGTPL